MNKKILLWFDVEDYLTPESDDAFYELLKMLDESGVKTTIKFCTKKLELLRERGRKDILSFLANHEMSFHTTNHSIHPMPTEYLDGYGFKEGAEEFGRREEPGFMMNKEVSGQTMTSYGHPGVAWAPHVFPALRKWGVPTYLDVHEIVGVGGQPFWYGGVLCFTNLNNLMHLVKDGVKGKLIKAFDDIDTECEDTVFISIYDHPTEFSSSEFWDECNFGEGKNPAVYQPAPLRTIEERDGLVDEYRQFIEYTTKQEDVEYVTALEAMKYEHHRTTPITGEEVKAFAEKVGTEVDYQRLGEEYFSAAELLNLMARYATGRVLTPEFAYGPERFEASLITSEVKTAELADALYHTTERVFGYKQIPSLYKVGENYLNPVDAFCTLAKAIATGAESLAPVTGRLKCADNVNMDYKFGGNWELWAQDFEARNIFEQTKLQTWTLKPARF